MSGISPHLAEAFRALRAELIGCTAALCGGTTAEADTLGRLTTEADARVQGNRPGKTAATLSDARLMLAGTLRVCLEHLENYRE